MATTVFNRTPLRGCWCIPIAGLVASMAFPAHAQVQQAWVARYNNSIANGTNQAVKMALDSNGNILVTGFSQNTNNQLGYVTIKYAPGGNQLWAVRYDSTNSPTAMPAAMALDNSNNVLITGGALTVKYDVNGNELWTAPYAGSALAVDASGNVGVTGFDTSFSTVRLNAGGSVLWMQTYSQPCGAVAIGQGIVMDSNNNTYVAGIYPLACQDDWELYFVKYQGSGSATWTATYGSGYPWQTASIGFLSSSNIYLAGNYVEGEGDYVAFLYNTNGTQVWSAFPNNNGYSHVHGSALGSDGTLFMTGQIFGPVYPVFSYGTIAIDRNGSTFWTSLYPTTAGPTSVANAITVDQANNSYVTGYSAGTNGTNNIVTIKYGPNGNQLWLQSYNGLNEGNDAGNAIAVDKNGNVYVTGYETLPGGGTGIVTIKYIPISIQRQTNGTVLIETQGTPGESFDIEASIDLLNWLDLGTVLADTNGLMMFDDTNAPNFPSRFYYTNPQ
jgi:hypothetical protein